MKTAGAKAVRRDYLPEAAAGRSQAPGKAGRRDPAAFYWHPWEASASLQVSNSKGQFGSLPGRAAERLR
jgi:hypothetical protein